MKDFIKEKHRFVAKTFQGLESVLAEELERLGADEVKTQSRAVEFAGDKELLYKVNLHSQLALRVLVFIGDAEAKTDKELYQAAYDIEWESFFSKEQTFAIDSVVHSQYFNHSKFAALRVKDAVVDRFRDHKGMRPNVKVSQPDMRLNVHIWEDKLKFYIDSSCEPLFKRGYRIQTHNAPMNEVLAAGLVHLSGWDGKQPFLDPMSGSGTIIIEAALKATHTAPGLFRKYFGFRNWENYDHALWRKLVKEAEDEVVPSEAKLYSADVSRKSLSIAKRNAESAGMIDEIQFQVRAFERTKKPEDSGVLIMNPPYGERMERDDATDLYKKIGDTLKAHYQDWDAWIITSNYPALEALKLKSSSRHRVYNGALECRYNGYQMYAGSRED